MSSQDYVMSGLINIPFLINLLLLLPFFCNLKTGGPLGLKNRFGRTWLINHQCWNPILFYFPTLFIFKWFPISILKLKPHEHQNPSLLIIEKLKKNYSPNDQFRIKVFIKISSFDSSQRVPPMSPCPPLIITRVCPLLINPLSDPWDFNNQILSKPLEFYEDLIDVSHIQSFMVHDFMVQGAFI